MDPDLLFTAGVTLIAFAIPGALMAYVGGFVPRFASAMGGVGIALIFLATTHRTFGYTFWEIPSTFTRVYLRYTQGG
jgi:energy-converting hydrogenase Eha subunit E